MDSSAEALIPIEHQDLSILPHKLAEAALESRGPDRAVVNVVILSAVKSPRLVEDHLVMLHVVLSKPIERV